MFIRVGTYVRASAPCRFFLEGGLSIVGEVPAISTLDWPVQQHHRCLKDATHLGEMCAVGAACAPCLDTGNDPGAGRGSPAPSSYPERLPLGRAAHLRCSSSCAYRKWSSALRATISAWQSLTTSPWSLMYSPLMHLVPEDRTTTCACLTSRPRGREGASQNTERCLPQDGDTALLPACLIPPRGPLP